MGWNDDCRMVHCEIKSECRVILTRTILLPAVLLLAFIGVTKCWSAGLPEPKVKLGNDVLMEKHLDLLKGKRVGLIINQTARLSSGKFLVDVLIQKGVKIVALFGPEHGVRGEAAAGEKVSDTIDQKSGIPIFSLYGKTRKPTPPMLANVDVLVYDIQDVGARFYTYISTMGLCMEAAAEKGIPFVVLDRPNPLGGLKIDGPVMEDSLKSFVGMYPIPVVYGLTCGELAMMINEEGWLSGKSKCKLTVIRVEGWARSMLWPDSGLNWIPPSPNIPTIGAASTYPATCFIEATNISEGRGTEKPFQYIGAPFIDGELLAKDLNKLSLEGVVFSAVLFTPTSSKFTGERCSGVFVDVTDANMFGQLKTAMALIRQLQASYPTEFKLRKSSFLRLMGSQEVYDSLTNPALSPPDEVPNGFSSLSSRYHLYN